MSIRRISMVLNIIVLCTLFTSQGGLCYTESTSTQSVDFNQHSSTTGGELSRYIDISSPFSGGYLYEDMTIIGSASVTESFTMDNLTPGSESDYWKKVFDDFGIGFDPGVPVVPGAAPSAGSAGSKPVSVVAGISAVAEAEGEADIRAGFRWLDLF